LRGAVPIVLALFAWMAGLPDAALFFEVTYVVVLASLVLQGATLGWSARRCGVNLPTRDDEGAHRAWFGDFDLDARMPAAAVCAFYGLREPGVDNDVPLGQWLQRQLGRPAVATDTVDWDFARFAVREMDGVRVARVGLRLRASSTGNPD
jgi:cell volume regulation protein A